MVVLETAFNFNGAQALVGTDAGLPSGLATRSYGFWFKTTNTVGINVMAWGQTPGTNDVRVFIAAGGYLVVYSGTDSIGSPFVADGQWHHIIVTEDNAAADGVRRKGYLDGRLFSGSSTQWLLLF